MTAGAAVRVRGGEAGRPRRGPAVRRAGPPPAGLTIAAVAYDPELAERIRALVAALPGLSEQRMFGGLAFLVEGNMAVAASGQGGLLVRVDPAQSERIIAKTSATEMVMRGRPMGGWLRVAAADVRTKRQLERWVRLGTAYAASLPPKHSTSNRARAGDRARR